MPTKHHGPTGTTASNPEPDPAFLRDSTGSRLYRLHLAGAGDVDQLTDLERDVFQTLWPPTNFAREIKKSGQAVLVATVRPGATPPPRSERNSSLVERVVGGIRTLANSNADNARNGDRIAGWTVVWFVAGEAHIASIGVAEPERRRGVGELLLLGAIEAAAINDCDELTLEVRKSNDAAQALYRKYGFNAVGERKGYYVDDNEDALIMTTPDIREPEYAARLAGLAADHARRWEDAGSRFERC
ncbi:MAG: ribosomal protein S18-alanine N-acetyltransferase [Dehalococcoidia bacterium]|jgi:ribosomal-protein-alanine N-acetyltransferase|nr:ribosomal protein S18-alanine N-acetyltransferase [Dehalococcoidia bacterium]